MNPFNNREIAIAIWLLLIFVFALSKRTVRKSLLNVIRAFFQPKILVWVSFMLLYTIGIVAGLYAAKFWNTTLLKATVVWLCFTAILLSFNFATSKSRENVFAKIIINNVKVVIIIEFLVNTYTFSLAGELVIVPFVTLIAMMDAVARADKKYSAAVKIITGLQIIIGVAILTFAVFKAVYDYENLLSIKALRNLFLAPVLSVLFSPFIYMMLLVTNYELLFIRLSMGPEMDRVLKRYAKRKIIIHCRLSLKRVREFLKVNALDLMRIQNRADVERMLKSDRSQQ